jgi:hypothetical protein
MITLSLITLVDLVPGTILCSGVSLYLSSFSTRSASNVIQHVHNIKDKEAIFTTKVAMPQPYVQLVPVEKIMELLCLRSATTTSDTRSTCS